MTPSLVQPENRLRMRRTGVHMHESLGDPDSCDTVSQGPRDNFEPGRTVRARDIHGVPERVRGALDATDRHILRGVSVATSHSNLSTKVRFELLRG